MHDVRSVNPYIKRIQYLGEINRLKRITTFLRTVQTICEVTGSEHRWQRQQLSQEHGPESEERAFIEDSRLRLQAVAAAKAYPEIYNDLLCRYLIEHATKAASRRVPLVGSLNRIRDVAKMYHDGDIKDIITALYVSYVNNPTPGKASQGTNLLLTLTQRNTLKLMGATTDLRKKVKTGLHGLAKPANKLEATRKNFLNQTVRNALPNIALGEWHLSYIGPDPADYAILADGSLSPLETIRPTAVDSHGGFYEHSFLWSVIQELTEEQRQAMGKFLRPKDFDGNLAATVNQADSEDIYRVLMYLKRLDANR